MTFGLFPVIAPNFGFKIPAPWPTILTIGGVLVLVVGLLTQVVGGSLREWFSGLERPLAAWLHKRRLDKLGMTPGEEAVDAASPEKSSISADR